ncbi:MAG: phosphoenolpyruvate---glycerone phosphotransferase subunit DhaL [Clostridiales bacterium]|jgi:dihydroxyacetone kinase-like protein|nr:phosphoenolpyruvate---glycerone phosphotransferase subunit DhaL [Clostridiales bacterium]MDN5297615.1 phosphoenolpyruvate---glycerone phosphotransferase subunit DhaL [Clostridiales bacterium]
MSKTLFGMIQALQETISSQEAFLTELDGAIGDADHGINMNRGFEAVITKFTEEDTDIGATLKKLGMTLLSTVGGASGPLYGTAFMRAGAEAQGKETLTLEEAEVMLAAAIKGIQDRGKAVKGEKTMLDAMMPAHDALKQAIADGLSVVEGLEKACAAANEGIEFTKTIRATKGRASYLGDRSIGHQDPGATSFTLMLETATKYLKA